MATPKQNIAGLDWVRFLAAVLVMIGHLGWWIWTADTSDPRSMIRATGMEFREWAKYTWYGWVGVQIFFVLSGFVIAYSAESGTALGFLRSRVTRLVPASLVCGTLSAIVLYAYGLHSPVDILLRLVRSVLISPIGPWIDDVYWTLGIELSFYLIVWALLARTIFNPDALALALISSSGLYWFLRAAAHMVPALSIIPNNRATQLLLLNHGEFFSLGILIYGISFKGPTKPRLLGSAMAATVGAASILATPAQAPVPLVIWLIAVAAICGSALVKSKPNDIARKFGLMSYPIYLLHYVVGTGLLALLMRAGLAPPIAIIVTMVSVILLAFCIVTWPEPWLQHNLKRSLASLTPRDRSAAQPR